MEELYFTIAGCSHYFGSDFIEKGMKVKLEKEPDNAYDKEAIQVKVKGLGKIGYVANSPYTVKGESMSAGRLYDKLGDNAHVRERSKQPKTRGRPPAPHYSETETKRPHCGIPFSLYFLKKIVISKVYCCCSFECV